jgi:hypothetical protein
LVDRDVNAKKVAPVAAVAEEVAEEKVADAE